MKNQIALCLILSLATFATVANAKSSSHGAKAEFEALSRQKAAMDVEQRIVAELQEKGCDTRILSLEQDEDGVSLGRTWYVSTSSCSCQVQEIHSFPPMGGATERDIAEWQKHRYDVRSTCIRK